MTQSRILLCGLALTLLVGSFAPAAPVPVLNLPKLVEEADVIVVGEVNQVDDHGPVMVGAPSGAVLARVKAAHIAVDQVFKGAGGRESLQFKFVVPDVAIGYGGVDVGSYGVFLLKRAGTDHEAVSPYYPFLPIATGLPRSSPSRFDDPVDRVVDAVGFALTSDGASVALKLQSLRLLWGLELPSAVEVLASALNDSDATVRLGAAASLLASGDIRALPLAANALLAPSASASGEVLLSNLRGAIRHGVTDEEAIPILRRLLRDGDTETRRAAAMALRRTRAVSAVRALVDGLGDDDFEVRLNVVLGLAEIAGQLEFAPSWTAFERDELPYMTHWRHWASVTFGIPPP